MALNNVCIAFYIHQSLFHKGKFKEKEKKKEKGKGRKGKGKKKKFKSSKKKKIPERIQVNICQQQKLYTRLNVLLRLVDTVSTESAEPAEPAVPVPAARLGNRVRRIVRDATARCLEEDGLVLDHRLDLDRDRGDYLDGLDDLDLRLDNCLHHGGHGLLDHRESLRVLLIHWGDLLVYRGDVEFLLNDLGLDLGDERLEGIEGGGAGNLLDRLDRLVEIRAGDLSGPVEVGAGDLGGLVIVDRAGNLLNHLHRLEDLLYDGDRLNVLVRLICDGGLVDRLNDRDRFDVRHRLDNSLNVGDGLLIHRGG